MPAYNPSIPIYPKGHLFGMTLSNNGSDATNDIDFAAGQCVDSTGVAFMVGSALTKQLDATWAAGTNAGGKMSAAAIANTTYHCFAIRKDSDGSVDYGFDVSATAPTMPSGYTYFRRIGSIMRLAGAIVAFSQNGDEFLLNVPVADVSANNPGTSAVDRALTVPIGIKVGAVISAGIYDATPAATTQLLITSKDQADTAATSLYTIATPGSAGAATIPETNFTVLTVRTNTSATIRTRLDTSTTDTYVLINTHGWIDTRGRLA